MTDHKPWTVEYEPRAIKDLRRLDRPIRARIVTAIDRLASHDPSSDVKRLSGMALYRLRVGDWRVLFTQDGDRLIVTIVRVLPRGRAYDR